MPGLRQRLANAASALLGRDAMPQISEYLFGQPWLTQLNEELNNAQAAARVATVSSCVSLLAHDLAGLPLRIYRVRGDKWVDVDDSHEIPTLLEYGNPVQSGYEVKRDWFSFWYVTGDASLFMERGPSRKMDPYELWAVPGHLLHEVPGARRSVKEFEYLPTHERFPAASFATLRHWSPSLNPLEPSPRGVSPLTAATDDYETLYRQSRLMRRFFEVGGRVQTALRPMDKDTKLNDAQIKAVQDQFVRRFVGIGNLDKPVILSGMEPVNLGLTMQQMEYGEVAKNAALGVCRVLHVPPVMIGIKDGGGLSDAGATTDFLIYADHGLRPPARLISAVVTKFVCSIFGPEYRAWLDVDSLMAVQRAKLEQAKSLVTLTGRPIIEVDEARTQLDMDPAPKGEGKGLWAPFTLAPVEIAAEPPPAPAPAPVPAEKPEAEARRAKLADDRRAHLRRWRDADLRRYERQVGAWARSRFSRQEDYALGRLEAQGVAAARLLRAAYSADDLMPEDSDEAEAQRMFEAIIAERGEAAAAEAGVDVVISIHQGRVADMIQTRAAQLVKGLDETTRAALAKKIEEITREGGSFEDLNRAVRQVFADRRANALTIARTETAWAYNLASVEAWETAGVEYISWMTSNDDAVRPSHQECEGLVRKIGDTFPNGLRWPGDTNGPPDETINCRCTPEIEFEAPESGSLSRMMDRRAQPRETLADLFEVSTQSQALRSLVGQGNGVAH